MGLLESPEPIASCPSQDTNLYRQYSTSPNHVIRHLHLDLPDTCQNTLLLQITLFPKTQQVYLKQHTYLEQSLISHDEDVVWLSYDEADSYILCCHLLQPSQIHFSLCINSSLCVCVCVWAYRGEVNSWHIYKWLLLMIFQSYTQISGVQMWIFHWLLTEKISGK